jgi:hypothetical protein
MPYLRTSAVFAMLVLLAAAALGDGPISDLLYRNVPYAKPVPGKPGFVFSPYEDGYKGLIDVRRIPPETEVKDPYTGKSFLVPKPRTGK